MTDQPIAMETTRAALTEALERIADEYRKHETREAALQSGLCLLSVLARVMALKSDPYLADRINYWRQSLSGDNPREETRELEPLAPFPAIANYLDFLRKRADVGSHGPESDLGPVLTYSLAVERVSQRSLEWWSGQEAIVAGKIADRQNICEIATEVVFKSWRTALSSRARNLYEYGPYPPSLGTLLSKLLSPGSGELLYDPTIGTGSLLFYLSKVQGAQNHEFCGQDINKALACFAEFVLRLNGGHPRFYDLDLFAEGGLPVEELGSLPDIVLLDPPWGRRLKREQEAAVIRRSRLLRNEPGVQSVTTEMAYLLHGIDFCNVDRGRLAALLPQGTSFRRGSDQSIRRILTERSEIPLRAVISLPPMMAYTQAAPVLLIFDARQGAGKVLFVDASNKQALENYELRQDLISQIVHYYQGGGEKEGIARWVARSAIKGLDYSWEVKRYVATLEELDGRSVAEARDHVATLELQLQESQQRLDGLLRRLSYWTDEPEAE